MNGVRSIYRRKGYCSLPLPRLCCLRRLLGRRGRSSWRHRNHARGATVGGRGWRHDNHRARQGNGHAYAADGGDVASNRTVTVDLDLATVEAAAATAVGATPGEFGQPGQVDDAGIVSNPRVTLTFAENTGSDTRSRTATGSITVRANDDADAENERVMVTGDAQGGGNANPTDPTPVNFTITDDETQTYVLTLDPVTHTSLNPPMEDEDIVVNLEAKPAHYQGGTTLTLQLAVNGGRATGYKATGD